MTRTKPYQLKQKIHTPYQPKSRLELDAMNVATRSHNGQLRKGSDGVPYIVHPLEVARLLQEAGESNETIAAGVLHDVVEDCSHKITLDDIRAQFGDEVAEMIAVVTKDKTIEDWRERNEAYLESIRTTQNMGALAICAADKLSNITDTINGVKQFGDAFWERFNAPKEDQLWWYRSVYDILAERIPHHTLVIRLGHQVVELEKLAA